MPICFEKPTLLMYTILLVIVVVYIVFYYNSFKNTNVINPVQVSKENSGDNKDIKDEFYKIINQLKDEKHLLEISNQTCNSSLQQLKYASIPKNASGQYLLDKITNPLVSPDTVLDWKYDAYTQYQMIGYLSSIDKGVFPVFARRKYPNRSDKYTYYSMTQSEHPIKIPFKSNNNDDELQDGDSVVVPEFGSAALTFKKYETEGYRYNPNVF